MDRGEGRRFKGGGGTIGFGGSDKAAACGKFADAQSKAAERASAGRSGLYVSHPPSTIWVQSFHMFIIYGSNRIERMFQHDDLLPRHSLLKEPRYHRTHRGTRSKAL